MYNLCYQTRNKVAPRPPCLKLNPPIPNRKDDRRPQLLGPHKKRETKPRETQAHQQQQQQPIDLVRRHRLPIIPRNLHLPSHRVTKAHPPRHQPTLLALCNQRLSRRADLIARPLDSRLLVLRVRERADADSGLLKDCKVVGAPPGLLAAFHGGDARGVVVVAVAEVV